MLTFGTPAFDVLDVQREWQAPFRSAKSYELDRKRDVFHGAAVGLSSHADESRRGQMVTGSPFATSVGAVQVIVIVPSGAVVCSISP